MIENSSAAALTDAERQLVHALRAIPDSPLKSRILDTIQALLGVGANPRCSEAQADGFPCACADSRCELCSGVFRRLDTIAAPAPPLRESWPIF
jgi:hypothetical protein